MTDNVFHVTEVIKGRSRWRRYGSRVLIMSRLAAVNLCSFLLSRNFNNKSAQCYLFPTEPFNISKGKERN